MSFDLLAPHYRWMEAVLAGEKLQRCRTAFLDRVEGRQRVLICGEGNGRFLAACRRRLPSARITCLDASCAMLATALARVRRGGYGLDGIEFICADAREWRWEPHSFDLVVTHFFLDCFERTELVRLIHKLAQAAAPSSAWLIADFHVPDRGLRRVRALLIHKLMYCFFRRVTGMSGDHLVLPDPWLEQEGFRCAEARASEWGLLRTELWRREM